MGLDILKESWVYQEMAAEILEQNCAEIEQRRAEALAEIEQRRTEALAEIEQRHAETLAQGREEGIEQGLARGRQRTLQSLQQAVITVVKARFPELERPARLIIATISDVDRLQVLIGDFSALTSLQEAQQLLLSLA
jgi:flagellar biosynthesis/type III secretory pathway protein FliH